MLAVNLLLIFVVLLILVQGFMASGIKLSALDSNIVFEGRSETDEKAATISFDQPGSRISFVVKGTTSVKMLVSSYVAIPNRFWVVVDGNLTGTVIDTTGMSTAVTSVIVASNLDPYTSYSISIVKITEAQFNALVPQPNYVTLHGFEVDETGRLLANNVPSRAMTRKIEFIGDSITAGYCNLCNTVDSTPGPYTQEANYWAYGTLTASRLHAAVHTSAWSGYGMVRNCCGGTTLMPEIYSRTLASVPGSQWNMSSWQANAVVVNLGTNDHLNSANPSGEFETSYVQTYVEFVQKINKAYSAQNPTFFLACGPMSSAYCGYVQNVLQQVTASGIKAHFLDFTQLGITNACCGHPSKADHTLMANTATKLIADVMKW